MEIISLTIDVGKLHELISYAIYRFWPHSAACCEHEGRWQKNYYDCEERVPQELTSQGSYSSYSKM